MFSLVLLVALGAVECTCVYLTRGPGGVPTAASHLLLLAAMVAMLAAPTDRVVAAGVPCVIGAIVAVALLDRLRKTTSTPICGGQLMACAGAMLTIVVAMALVPESAADFRATSMPGMVAASSAPSSWVPTVTATVVLVLFAIRAVAETVRAVRETVPALRISRTGQGSVLRHFAAAAGSMSMVVMCAAMGAF